MASGAADGYRYGWLIWLAAATASCLPPLGVPSFTTLGVSACFVGAWVFLNVSPKKLLTSIIFMVLDIFFREMSARNQFKVPPNGSPCIFVCAPHANQFLDPFVVQYAVGRTDLAYLAAAKSMRRKFVGAMARSMESIPVERPQDIIFQGQGEVWLSPEDRMTLQGRATNFLGQIKVGDLVTFGKVTGAVAAIASDESLTLKRAAETLAAVPRAWSKYKVTPRVDQSSMFNAVTDALVSGKSVGIFPEGGSHDQPTLLPLKAGIAIMAMSTLTARPDLPLSIVPVGLNYFSGHRFRSRVFIDIGDPLIVPADLVKKYGTDKHAATAELMAIIEDALKALTVGAADYETLEFFWTLRRLTKTSGSSLLLTLAQQVEFARRFAVDYERVLPDGSLWKESPAVQRVRTMCSDYNSRLKSFGLRDYQVIKVLSPDGAASPASRRKAAFLLVWRALLIIVYVACLLPMALLCLPMTLVTRSVARCKTREAVQASSVKIYGRDVAATWKLMVAIVLAPSLWLTYTAAAAAFAGLELKRPWTVEVPLLVFFFFPLVGYGAILAAERLTLIARSMPPLVALLLHPSYAQELLDLRNGLVDAMQGLVDANGWQVRAPERSVSLSCGSSVDLEELERIHTEATPRPSQPGRRNSRAAIEGFAAPSHRVLGGLHE